MREGGRDKESGVRFWVSIGAGSLWPASAGELSTRSGPGSGNIRPHRHINGTGRELVQRRIWSSRPGASVDELRWEAQTGVCERAVGRTYELGLPPSLFREPCSEDFFNHFVYYGRWLLESLRPRVLLEVRPIVKSDELLAMLREDDPRGAFEAKGPRKGLTYVRYDLGWLSPRSQAKASTLRNSHFAT